MTEWECFICAINYRHSHAGAWERAKYFRFDWCCMGRI